MRQNEQIELLKKELAILNEAGKILARSYQRCQEIGVKKDYTLEEQDHFEGLTSRFARLSDILIQKIFRLIEILDLPGTIRDRVNRAEKKGLIASANTFANIRDLRNNISHEYTPSHIHEIYTQVIEWTPDLLETIKNVEKYCKKYHD